MSDENYKQALAATLVAIVMEDSEWRGYPGAGDEHKMAHLLSEVAAAQDEHGASDAALLLVGGLIVWGVSLDTANDIASTIINPRTGMRLPDSWEATAIAFVESTSYPTPTADEAEAIVQDMVGL